MTDIIPPLAEPSPAVQDVSEFDAVAARKQWQVILKRFLRHRLAVGGLALFVLLLLFAFVGDRLWKYSYLDLNLGRYEPPHAEHPFGTGHLGEDMLAQVIRGTQFSLRIAMVVAVLATLIGVVLGALAGYLRGWVDSVISRLIDLFLIFPAIAIVAVLSRQSFVAEATKSGNGAGNWLFVSLVIVLVLWLPIGRVIRGVVLSLREKEFVEAARALGGSTWRIVFRHIVPNTVDVIIVNATIVIAQAVLLEAALSYVGIGVQSPDTSLGLLISYNKNELTVHPWLFWFPFIFIVLISLSVNFIGDGLRDAFDPRQRRVRA